MSTKKNKVLVLRTCNPDMTSYGQFKWPESGQVKAPDWDATPKCGHGLHGLLWGEGNAELLNWDVDAKWLVVEVDEEKIVKIDEDKVKFPCGKVVYCGDRKSATDLIIAKHNNPSKCVGCFVTVGDNDSATAGNFGTATAGYGGTATAGNAGTATAGYHGTATAGYHGTSTAGNYGTATAGYHGTATAGEYGTATAGEYGTATAGDGGTATAGYRGTATAGNGGTATAGDDGTATAGDDGTATAGEKGILNIKYWDDKNNRFRIATAYVGEDGIEPNVAYRLDCSKAKPKFVKVNE